MAGEIQARDITGVTVYAQVWNSIGQIWNTASSAFQAYNTANIADYDIALTEQGTASGKYIGDMPALSAGLYGIEAFRRAGGSPAETDIPVAVGAITWNGSVAVGQVGVLFEAEPEVQKNDVGRVLVVEFLDESGNVIDISSATTKQIVFRKPGGALLTKSGTFHTDGTDGLLNYTTAKPGGVYDMDTIGRWQIQGYVVIGTNELRTNIGFFEVAGNLE